MAAELKQVLEDINKAKDDIMAAEKSLNEVEEKLKTAKAIQAKKLNADQDYLRTLKISLLQLLSGLQQVLSALLQDKNRLVEAQDRSELDSSFRLVGSCHARFMAFNRLGIRTSHRLLDCACELLPFVRSDRRIRF